MAANSVVLFHFNFSHISSIEPFLKPFSRQGAARRCKALQGAARRCKTLQDAARRCKALQGKAARCEVLGFTLKTKTHVLASVLERSAVAFSWHTIMRCQMSTK
jgi:hypothetical protein